MWKMFAFVKVLPRPGAGMLRKMLMLAFVVCAAVGAFFWGRLSATQSGGPKESAELNSWTQAADLPNPQGVVAHLKGNIAITRQELGEYLIARFGADRIQAMVNRRIIELACREKNIFVSNEEVDQQLAEDLRALGANNIKQEDFVNTILKRFNKTMYEWKEDIIRPRIAMNKLVRSEINIDQRDLQDAYEMRYGPKVECRMIVMKSDFGRKHWARIQEEVRFNEEAFRKAAKDPAIQFIDVLRTNEGKVPAIHKHFGDAAIETAAFALREGEVSVPIEMPDKTGVILKCDKQLPAMVNPPPFDDRLRADLYRDVLNLKISQRIPAKLQQLNEEWAPKIHLKSLARHLTQDPQLALSVPPSSSEEIKLVHPPASALLPEGPLAPTPPKVEGPPAPAVPLVPPPSGSVTPDEKAPPASGQSVTDVLTRPPSIGPMAPSGSVSGTTDPGASSVFPVPNGIPATTRPDSK